MYGSSREVVSSADSFTFTDARASSRGCSLGGPTSGALIPGLDSSQASATCARNAPRRRDRRHAIDDLAVRVGGVREEARDRLVGLGPDARVVPVPRQPPTGLRAPGDDADPLGRAKWQHFALLLAVEQVHEVLHADEAGPAVTFGNPKSPGELPRMHRGPADITDLPGLDDVVERFEGLLDWGAIIPAVDLIEVDVIGAEAPQAGVDLHHD